MNQFICFVHIGKNGGSTFHHVLNDNLPRYLSLNYHRGVEIVTPAHIERLERFGKLSGLGGHTVRPYMNYDEAIEGTVFYITFLREPIKRFISYVNHRIWRGWSENLEEVLEQERFDNLQTKYLFKDGVILEDKIEAVFSKINFVGIVERYDDSLVLLKQVLPDTLIDIRYQKANVASDRQTNFYEANKLSDELKARIVEKNVLDQKLYQLGVSNFNKMIESYNGDFDSDVKSFKESNKNFVRPRSKTIQNKLKNGLGNKFLLPHLSKFSKV